MTSVLVVAEEGRFSASTRYRALQHVPRLAAYYDHVDVALSREIAPPLPRFSSRARFLARNALTYGATALALTRTVSRYDAVFVQRGLYSMGPGTIVRVLERYRGRVVFDLDDAVFLPRPGLAGRSRLARWLYGPQQAMRLLRRADAVIVSTEVLAAEVSRYRVADAILPTVPDPGAYPLATPGTDARPVVLGWVGTVRNVDYLEPLRSVLAGLTHDGIAELVVISAHPWPGPARFRRWTLAQEASVFTTFAIGLMPLPDTPYTRAKAGFKLLQYMAAGVPFVASPVGVNRELAERSGAGILADGPQEWEAAIRTLAADPDLRVQLGSRGRSFVARYADLDGQAATIAGLLAP